MDRLATAILIAFATWHAVEVYHHSDLFARVRAEIESLEGNSIYMSWFAEGMQCPFCLSLWVAWVNWLLWQLPGAWLMVVGLASARGANLLNDITHKYCRTPGSSNVQRYSDGILVTGEAERADRLGEEVSP